MHLTKARTTSARTLPALGLLICLAGAAGAQTTSPYSPPRTADGRPDLQGLWAADFATPLEREDGVSGLIVAPEDAAALLEKMKWTPDGVYDPDIDYFMPDTLLSVAGTLRSSWLVEPSDGKMPYTALAELAMDRDGDLFEHGYDNPEERPTAERCVSGLGYPPLHGISPIIPNLIVQTPVAIVVATEDTDAGRIIHMTGPAPPQEIRTRSGYSAGRWEGDVLVVETTHFAAGDPSGALYRDAVVVGEGSVVIERFSLMSDGELFYQFTVRDPTLYNRSWLAEYVMTRSVGDSLTEYACHEGNTAIPNVLMAGRLGRQPVKK